MATTNKKSRLRRDRADRLEGMDAQILDVEGAARFLGVSTSTIYKLARSGKLPGVRVGREWRFTRPVLLQWVSDGTEASQLAKLLSKTRPARKP